MIRLFIHISRETPADFRITFIIRKQGCGSKDIPINLNSSTMGYAHKKVIITQNRSPDYSGDAY